VPRRHKRGKKGTRPDRTAAHSRARIDKTEADEMRAREIEEEREGLIERIDAIPDLRKYVAASTGIPIRTVRAYVREHMVPELVSRMFDVAMGVQTFKVATMVGTIVEVPASATVQTNTARALVELGVPRPRANEGEGVPFSGVLVLGELELGQARERAASQRIEDHGYGQRAIGAGGYVPPEGHQVKVIEDDLSNVTRTNPDAPPAPIDPHRPLTKAQEIAARRRAEGTHRRAG
jgi:hypothetical protein